VVDVLDNRHWQLLVRIAADERLTGWADIETLAPAAVSIIQGEGMAMPGLKPPCRDLALSSST
jgi:hypothetical protein